MLFREFSQYYKDDNWKQTPFVAGSDTTTQDTRNEIKRIVHTWAKILTSCDVSGYEFSTDKTLWMLWTIGMGLENGQITIESIHELLQHNATPAEIEKFLNEHKSDWVRMAMLYNYKCANPHVIFEDGTEMILTWDQFEKLLWRNPSGHKMTSLFGSWSRMFREEQMAQDNGFRGIKCYTQGDDIVSNLPPGILSKSTNYGMKITDIQEDEQWFTFIGWKFNLHGNDELSNPIKTLTQFANSEKSQPQWDGLKNSFGIPFVAKYKHKNNPFCSASDRGGTELTSDELKQL